MLSTPKTFQCITDLDQFSFMIQLTTKIAAFFIKSSILAFYVRIFRGGWFCKVAWACVILNGAWSIAFFFATLFQCHPISAAWKSNPQLNTQQCVHATKLYLSASISSAIFDFVLILLPQPVLWRLQMPLRKKMAISAIFLLGLW